MLTTFRDIWTGCRPGGHGGIFRVLTGQRSELDGHSGDTAMSTIPKPDRSAASPRRSERIKSPKTTSPSAKTVAGPPGASKPLASLKYGWRDVPKKLADGRIKVERVPLTLDDVVHPQFGDVHVLSDAHDDDCSYMKDVLKDRYRDDASVVVFSDCGIFWDKPGLRHHSPDLALIFGVSDEKGGRRSTSRPRRYDRP